MKGGWFAHEWRRKKERKRGKERTSLSSREENSKGRGEGTVGGERGGGSPVRQGRDNALGGGKKDKGKIYIKKIKERRKSQRPKKSGAMADHKGQ